MTTVPDGAVVEVRRAGGALVARLVGPDCTSTYANKLCTVLHGIADHGYGERVVLDLSEVTRCFTPLLGIFITVQRQLQANAGALRLCGGDPAVQEVLAATRLGRLFSVHRDAEAATSGW